MPLHGPSACSNEINRFIGIGLIEPVKENLFQLTKGTPFAASVRAAAYQSGADTAPIPEW